jgi:uncharacterized protein (DUF433 family)
MMALAEEFRLYDLEVKRVARPAHDLQLTNHDNFAMLTVNIKLSMPHQRIEMNPKIMDGKPVIHGTRIPVELVLRKLGAGMSPEAIFADHPRLTREDILAAQAFAADYLSGEEIIYR